MDFNDYEHELLLNITEHGWQCCFVFNDKNMAPDFSYSVGFTQTLDAPEFIIFGLSNELMHNMLWELFNKIQDGLVVKDKMSLNGLIEGFDCVLKKTNHKKLFTEYATYANWLWKLNENEGYPDIYQIVWPGAQQGLFPWDKGCVQDVIDAQPPLWKDSNQSFTA